VLSGLTGTAVAVTGVGWLLLGIWSRPRPMTATPSGRATAWALPSAEIRQSFAGDACCEPL